ncbi:RidA family protein [Candidatus Daviesbacteria bacterium]|nr:RidA family protein [Candidatus Daviesbacteria bacterium]
MKEIQSDKVPNAVGPYSQAVKVNGFVFCSGQIGLNPETNQFAGESVEEQTEQILKNLRELLKAASATFADVVRCDIFLTNISDFAKVNEIYSKFFPLDPKPARQTVEVSNLPKGALIEISCIASI